MLRLACAYAAAASLHGPFLVGGILLACVPMRPWSVARSLGWLPAILAAVCLGRLERVEPAPALPDAGVAVCVRGWMSERAQQRGSQFSSWMNIEALSACDTFAPDDGTAAWSARRVRLRGRVEMPAYGQRCIVRGVLRPPRPARNFAAFDERRFMRARGGDGILHVEELALLPGKGGAAWRRQVSEPVRERIRAALQESVAPREAALLAALVLGIREGLDDQLAESWRAWGMSHVLALSGLHVGLVAGALLWIARTPRTRVGFAVLLAGVGAYAALGGLGPSVARAAGMAAWMACAVHVGRTPHALTALACATAFLVFDAPERARDLRLQLSFLATLGILVWLPTLTRLVRHRAGTWRRRIARVVGVCGVGLAAQTATLPIIVAQFGVLSWAAPLANVTFVPVVGAALLVTLAGLPVHVISDTLAQPLWLVAAALLHAMLRVTDLVPEHVDPRLFVPAATLDLALAWLVSTAALGTGLCAARRMVRCTRLAAGLALASALALATASQRARAPSWEVVALDVGQGDALVLRIGTAAWLIDAGHDQPVDSGARTIVPHLRRAGVRRLRGLVLTHPHRDHYGGAASVLANIPVDTVYVAQASLASPPYVALQRSAPGVPWCGIVIGRQLALGAGYTAEVLWPPGEDRLGSGANGVSVTLWARGPGFPSLLATGDLEADGEAAVLASMRTALDDAAEACLLLKVGHHGSRTSSTPEFLDAVDAEIAVISAGARNRFGHPAAQTLSALDARGCTVLRTDRGGAIRVVQRARSLWIERPTEPASVAVSEACSP